MLFIEPLADALCLAAQGSQVGERLRAFGDVAQQRGRMVDRHGAGAFNVEPLPMLAGDAKVRLDDRHRGNAPETDNELRTDQIALLTGLEPGALDQQLGWVSPIPMPPAQVAGGDPATMLRNRPDIRIAERQLAAANADVGASIAEKFPKVSFMGLLGLGGGSVSDMLDPSELIGLVLPRISWNLFDGGRADAKVEASRGAYAEAEAQYRATVLSALNDAENALTRFGGDRITFGKALDAQVQGARTVVLQRQRADAGTIGDSDALTAERQQIQLALAVIDAQAELSSDYVAVQKALGLGWDIGSAEMPVS